MSLKQGEGVSVSDGVREGPLLLPCCVELSGAAQHFLREYA